MQQGMEGMVLLQKGHGAPFPQYAAHPHLAHHLLVTLAPNQRLGDKFREIWIIIKFIWELLFVLIDNYYYYRIPILYGLVNGTASHIT